MDEMRGKLSPIAVEKNPALQGVHVYAPAERQHAEGEQWQSQSHVSEMLHV
jgi:hypothetical protein